MIESFIIQIKNGVIYFSTKHHRKVFDNFVAQFKDDRYRLEINSIRSKRTDEQNRYYWMYLGVIEEDTGYEL